MRQEEARVSDQARKPALLEVTRCEVAKQYRNLPVLHQLVGESRIAAGDFFRDECEGLHLGRGLELHAAELFGDTEGADADPVGSLEDLTWQALFGLH